MLGRLWRNVDRVRRLSRGERRALLDAYVALLVVAIELRWFGYRRLIRRIENVSVRGRDAPLEPDAAEAFAKWLAVASRHHLIRAQCLHRSLALHRRVRREGLSSQLRIGVVKDGSDLKAHAWVELNGSPVGEDPDGVARFAVLRQAGRPGPARGHGVFARSAFEDAAENLIRSAGWLS